MSRFPERFLQEINDRANVRHVIELIGYLPGRAQETNAVIKCNCPIHRDRLFRNLTIDKVTRRFQCAQKSCAGAPGGDLITLYALAKSMEYDDAAEALAAEFRIDLSTTVDADYLSQRVTEAQRILSDGQIDAADGIFAELLEVQPDFVDAEAGRAEVAAARGDVEALARHTERAAGLALAAGRPEESLDRARALAELKPEWPSGHRIAGDALVALGKPDDALDYYMAAADAAEAAGDHSAALEAYLRADELGSDILDTQPHVDRCFESAGGSAESMRVICESAERAAGRGDFRRAANLFSMLIDSGPEADGHRERFLDMAFRAEPWEEWEERALGVVDRLLARSAYDRAADALRRLLELRPDHLDALNRLSAIYRVQGMLEEAVEIEVQLARRRHAQGETHEAMDDLEAILDGSPDHIPALRALLEIEEEAGYEKSALRTKQRLGTALARAGQHEEADRFLKSAVEADPSDNEAREARAWALEQWALSGHADAAVEGARELEAIADSFVTATRGRRAIDYYTRAAQLAPPTAGLLLKIAAAAHRSRDASTMADSVLRAIEMLTAAGQIEEAVAQGTHFADLSPDSRELVHRVADLLKQQGQAGAAVSKLRKLAEARTAAGDRESAVEALDKAVALDPGDVATLEQLAKAYRRFGDELAAGAMLSRVATLHEEAERLDVAARVLQELANLRPDDRAVLERLASLAERTGSRNDLLRWRRRLAKTSGEAGDREAEVRELRRIVELVPTDEDAMRQLAAAERAAGHAGEALQVTTMLARHQVSTRRHDKAAALIRESCAQVEVVPPEWMEIMWDSLLALGQQSEALNWGGKAVEAYGKAGRTDDEGRLLLAVTKEFPHQDEWVARRVEWLRGAGRADTAVAELVASGNALIERGDRAQAERRLREAVEADPTRIEALEGLSRLHLEAGDTAAASDALLRAAEELDMRGDTDEAIACARRATDVHPASTGARRLLTRFLRDARRPQEAVTALREISERLAAAGDAGASATALEEAHELAPDDAALRSLLIDRLGRAGQGMRAAQELEAVAAELEEGGDLKGALEALDRAQVLLPDGSALRVKRANLLAALGRTEEALDEFKLLGSRLASVGTGQSAEPVALSLVADYDFESFVVGGTNNFAHATAMAVAKAPGRAYNPLFLYSDVGLGKTHLVNAIANFLLKNQPGANILYTGCEDFVSELVEAIEHNAIAPFRQRYRAADLLVVDDVQFLAGKERAQEEFFHVFNALFQAGKQIVVTSDRPPRDIAHLEKRLLSRFGAGVIVDIGAPDLETRLAILKRMMGRASVQLEGAIIQYMAESAGSNIRDLKGAFNRVRALKENSTAPVTLETVRQALEKLYATPVP